MATLAGATTGANLLTPVMRLLALGRSPVGCRPTPATPTRVRTKPGATARPRTSTAPVPKATRGKLVGRRGTAAVAHPVKVSPPALGAPLFSNQPCPNEEHLGRCSLFRKKFFPFCVQRLTAAPSPWRPTTRRKCGTSPPMFAGPGDNAGASRLATSPASVIRASWAPTVMRVSRVRSLSLALSLVVSLSFSPH